MNIARSSHGSCATASTAFVFCGNANEGGTNSCEYISSSGSYEQRRWRAFTVQGLGPKSDLLVANVNDSRILIAGGVFKSDGVVIDAETRKVAGTFEDGSFNFQFIGNQCTVTDFGRIAFVAKDNASN